MPISPTLLHVAPSMSNQPVVWSNPWQLKGLRCTFGTQHPWPAPSPLHRQYYPCSPFLPWAHCVSQRLCTSKAINNMSHVLEMGIWEPVSVATPLQAGRTRWPWGAGVWLPGSELVVVKGTPTEKPIKGWHPFDLLPSLHNLETFHWNEHLQFVHCLIPGCFRIDISLRNNAES